MKSLLSTLSPLLFAPILASAAAPVPPGPPAIPAESRAAQDATLAPRPAFDGVHAPWNRILAKRAHGVDFDFADLAEGSSALDAYLAALESVDGGVS